MDSTPTAPHPGHPDMPRWNLGELPEAPVFAWRNWLAMLGPGIFLGSQFIGGGEWLLGPLITAKFGGGLLWLALMSILGQLVYNIEISRYTLYSGEPIFSGKFRTLPGPLFWVCVYLVIDFGSLFPYLAANAATPLVALFKGTIPDPDRDAWLLRLTSIAILLGAMIPLLFGGKVYNAIRVLMGFKLVYVMGFLLLVAVLFSTRSTWVEIASGFFKFGNVPIKSSEDLNGNGRLDPGEDWDGDGHLDALEVDENKNGKLDPQEDLDGDGMRDGDRLDNIFLALWEGRFPQIEPSMIALLCGLIAISGGGGTGNTLISNFTRDQGWGMGKHVGAIPSMIGGHHLELSHVGTVFEVTPQVLPRWRRWYWHVCRDQMFLWLPASLFGVALPCMLSIQFLPRGFDLQDPWLCSVMTANAISENVGPAFGNLFWYMTIFCGFVVLGLTVAPAADGFVRRWVDTFWTSSRWLRSLHPRNIRYVYFSMLTLYMVVGVILLCVGKPTTLLLIAGVLLNYALGISCWHTLAVNVFLLPRPLRPGWFLRTALFLAGLFFVLVATLSTLVTFSS